MEIFEINDFGGFRILHRVRRKVCPSNTFILAHEARLSRLASEAANHG